MAVDPVLIKKQSIDQKDDPDQSTIKTSNAECKESSHSVSIPAVQGTLGAPRPQGHEVTWNSGQGNTTDEAMVCSGGSRGETGAAENRSFREKLFAFEKFTRGSGPVDAGSKPQSRSRRWMMKHTPSTTSSTTTTTSTTSSSKASTTDTPGGDSRKRKDRKKINKNGCETNSFPAEQEVKNGKEEEQEEAVANGDRREDMVEKRKRHWTVRLSQQLMKIRGKLEQRANSKHRNNDRDRSEGGLNDPGFQSGSGQGLTASSSSIFQTDSGLGNSSTSVSAPDREQLISRSCSELYQSGRTRNKADRKSEIPHFRSPEFPDKLEPEEEEKGGERNTRNTGTKSSFLSELRKFYDRSADRKSEKRGFFNKGSRKSKGVSGRINDRQEATYIEADRIDREITTATTTTTSALPEESTSGPTEAENGAVDAQPPVAESEKEMGTRTDGKRRQQVTPVPWKKPLSGISIFGGGGEIEESEVKVEQWEAGGVKVEQWEGGDPDGRKPLPPENSEYRSCSDDILMHQ